MLDFKKFVDVTLIAPSFVAVGSGFPYTECRLCSHVIAPGHAVGKFVFKGRMCQS